MRRHERFRRLLRAAHALGAAGLFALAATMVFSLPVRAETPDAMPHFPAPLSDGAIFTTTRDCRPAQ